MNEKEIKKFYNSKEWKTKRIDILMRDNFECRDCRERLERAAEEKRILSGKDRKIRRATEAHHIREFKEFPELALNDDNLISLCTQCHNARHGRNPKRFVRKKKLISVEMW